MPSRRLDHPEGCGCQVCRQYRQRLEDDPRAREVDASESEVDRHAADVEDWRDSDPPVEEQPESPQRVVVEHRHVVEDKRESERKTRFRRSKDGKDGKDGKRGPRGKRGRGRHGILRTLVVGCLLVWVLQSFYPELDVPLIPGVACTSPGETTNVFDGDPALWNPFSLGSKVKELAEDTVSGVVKKAALFAATTALNLAGDTFRVMAAHPPTTEGIRQGLLDDVTTVGKVAGFVAGGLTGKPVEELVPSVGAVAVADSGCEPCLSTGGSSSVVAGSPVEAAARAVLAAGPKWAGGGEDAVWAVEVAGAESTFRPGVRNSIGASGLFQILLPTHEGLFDGPWSDPYANARAAYRLWERDGRGPWVSSESRWGDFEGQARTAIAAVRGTDATPVSAGSTDPRVGDSGSVPTQPVALKAASFIRSEFAFDGTIGGSADSGHITGSLHYRGLALDVMVSGSSGQRIYDYFAGPGYRPFGVDNVIFEHRIYNAGRGDHAYSADDHMNHVHIDFHPEGGAGSAPAAGTAQAAACVGPVGGVAAGGWRVGSFNVLGASHTALGGNKPQVADWDVRWPGVPRLLSVTGASVVGFQELQAPQFAALSRVPGWQATGERDNVIGWRSDVWKLKARSAVTVPYFRGAPRRMPLVQLEHRESGQAVWFLNVHNPADTHGPAQRWRNIAVAREAAAVSRLSGPVVWLGDFNDQNVPFDRAGFRSAVPSGIDQIAGGAGASLGGGRRLRAGVREVSDHPFVYADLSLATTL